MSEKNSNTQDILADVSLVPDADADEELGAGDTLAIADQDIRGCRLLIVRRTAEPVDINGVAGGAAQLTCTFQPAPGLRFIWARLVLRITNPPKVAIVDVAPREVREDEPVRFSIDGKGKIGVNYQFVEVGTEEKIKKEYSLYHCLIQGSGEGTSIARWDFAENPHRRDGVSREQVVAVTLPVHGVIKGDILVTARVSRAGVVGTLDAVRDLVVGHPQRRYPIQFFIPESLSLLQQLLFLRL